MIDNEGSVHFALGQGTNSRDISPLLPRRKSINDASHETITVNAPSNLQEARFGGLPEN
jgi:hypothetical protein